jgi:ATP-dependent helicase Lhr and Lhr-like helicase
MQNTGETGKRWFKAQGWTPFPFQLEAWQSVLAGLSGMINAPTGSGKTYSLLIPILLEADPRKQKSHGPTAIWITPIRALAKEIEFSAQRAADGLDTSWRIGVRSGDTSTKERARQKEKPPDFLITTPESLHLLISQKGYAEYFANLKTIVVDEWHELLALNGVC